MVQQYENMLTSSKCHHHTVRTGEISPQEPVEEGRTEVRESIYSNLSSIESFPSTVDRGREDIDFIAGDTLMATDPNNINQEVIKDLDSNKKMAKILDDKWLVKTFLWESV